MIDYKKKYLKYKKKYLNLKNKLKGGGEGEYNYKNSIKTFLDETIIKELGGQINEDKGYYWIILEGMEKEGNCWSDILYEKEKKNKKEEEEEGEEEGEEEEEGEKAMMLRKYQHFPKPIVNLYEWKEEPTTKEILDAYSKVFKFHLQPTKENVKTYLENLIELYNSEEKKKFRKAVRCIKVVEDYDKTVIGNLETQKISFPALVIYPKCNEDDLKGEGNENWRIVYEELKEFFKDECQEDSLVYQKGLSYTPRYNIPITKNKLLFIANGDGDYKKPFIDINSETLEKNKKQEKQAIIRKKTRIEKQLENCKLTHGEYVEKLAIEDKKQEQLEQTNEDSIKKFIFANVEDLELTEELTEDEKELYKYAFFSQNQELLKDFLVKN